MNLKRRMKRNDRRAKGYLWLSDRIVPTPSFGRQRRSMTPKWENKKWGKKYRFRRYTSHLYSVKSFGNCSSSGKSYVAISRAG